MKSVDYSVYVLSRLISLINKKKVEDTLDRSLTLIAIGILLITSTLLFTLLYPLLKYQDFHLSKTEFIIIFVAYYFVVFYFLKRRYKNRYVELIEEMAKKYEYTKFGYVWRSILIFLLPVFIFGVWLPFYRDLWLD